MVKLLNPMLKRTGGSTLIYIPIEIYFLREKGKFDQLILEKGIF